MPKWDWLTQPEQPYTWGFFLRVLLKAGLLFGLIVLLFAVLQPLPLIGRVSVYNSLVPGRERLPYGENAAQAYNLSLNSLDAMFASHVVSTPKADDEFRVLLIGDSATWGVLLEPQNTLAAMLNAQDMTTPDGQTFQFYNLGYPIMSLTKDLMLLEYAQRYEPDLIIWLFTLESFPWNKQLFPPLVQNNPDAVRNLIATYDLALDSADDQFVDRDFWGETLIGRRRDLADWLRLQVYGSLWNVTGIDQYYPESYTPRQEDFEVDVTFHDFTEPQVFTAGDLAVEVLHAGEILAGNVPVLFVNEPMFVSDGENSDLRYNFFYPRWAYDSYHDLIAETASQNGWLYLDAWNAIDFGEYTDSAVHYTPAGAAQFTEIVALAVKSLVTDGQLP